MKYTKRVNCRVCGGKLKRVFSLGNLYISTFVDNPRDHVGRAPLKLVLCRNCSLVQLQHTAPQELMYSGHYWYKSGINSVIVNDLKEIAQDASYAVESKPGDVWIDVGANDGTLLKFVDKDRWHRIGVEPAKNLFEELKENCETALQSFWEDVSLKKKAKVITAIGMFYDSENPNLFIKKVAECLDDDGIFVTQLMTLWPMIKKNDLGNICHEHLEYYSYKSLKYLFEKNGLEIYKVEENNINGGSYRIYARKFYKYANHIKIDEPEIGIKELRAFYKRLKQNRRDVVGYIKSLKKEGRLVFGYGASTKGNTLLQWYGLTDKHIDAIADKNEGKWGKYTVGTRIPIISEEEGRNLAYYFLILPWGFVDTFYSKEADWLSKGGKFITHTPEFGVLSAKYGCVDLDSLNNNVLE